MPTFLSGDAQLFYRTDGAGPPVVLLHPFPVNNGFWGPVAQQLGGRYRLIMPDLRGHGDSDLGEGPATMEKLAADLANLCREEDVGKAVFVGVSIGGYTLFEFWRRSHEQVGALVLANTRAGAETAEGRNNRLKIADKVLQEGTREFIEEMLPKVLGAGTRSNRPDLVAAARRMMQKMSPQDVAGVQRGMAERKDSVALLSRINVPTLIIAGEEDGVPIAEAELMRQHIPGSQLQVISGAGHYAALEKPEEFGGVLRTFLDRLPREWQ
jgi:3-oxoadipate enol-lactonase